MLTSVTFKRDTHTHTHSTNIHLLKTTSDVSESTPISVVLTSSKEATRELENVGKVTSPYTD